MDPIRKVEIKNDIRRVLWVLGLAIGVAVVFAFYLEFLYSVHL